MHGLGWTLNKFIKIYNLDSTYLKNFKTYIHRVTIKAVTEPHYVCVGDLHVDQNIES